jgi:predicted transcriptional regulator
MKFNRRKFRSILIESGLTVRMFSEKVDVPLSTMNYNLSKQNDMKLSFFFMLCNELNVEPSVLIKQD